MSIFKMSIARDRRWPEACLAELGCRGPAVQCNIAERGVIDGHGGCMDVGGIRIGCTMPGFPDRFSSRSERPRFEDAEGSTRAAGGFLRRIRSVRTGRSQPPARTRRRPAAATTSARFYPSDPAGRARTLSV